MTRTAELASLAELPHSAYFTPAEVAESADAALSTASRLFRSGPKAPQKDRFDHYCVLRKADGSPWELGRGAMGITYKAEDVNLQCPVALKVIERARFERSSDCAQFVREARAAALLRHQNVASVHHLGKDLEHFFYAMDFIEGETAEALVASEGPMAATRALRIIQQVAAALAAGERHHLVHRDIKPANIMISSTEEDATGAPLAKVIDFGLVRSALEPAGSGAFAGTPQFASPEQLEERPVDGRSDLYSLGCTLWFLLKGKAPFTGPVAKVCAEHLNHEPPWEELRGVPKPVQQLLTRLLQKEPSLRPASASALRPEIARCLESVEQGCFHSTLHEGGRWFAKHPITCAAAMVAVAAILAGAFEQGLAPERPGKGRKQVALEKHRPAGGNSARAASDSDWAGKVALPVAIDRNAKRSSSEQADVALEQPLAAQRDADPAPPTAAVTAAPSPDAPEQAAQIGNGRNVVAAEVLPESSGGTEATPLASDGDGLKAAEESGDNTRLGNASAPIPDARLAESDPSAEMTVEPATPSTEAPGALVEQDLLENPQRDPSRPEEAPLPERRPQTADNSAPVVTKPPQPAQSTEPPPKVAVLPQPEATTPGPLLADAAITAPASASIEHPSANTPSSDRLTLRPGDLLPGASDSAVVTSRTVVHRTVRSGRGITPLARLDRVHHRIGSFLRRIF